MFIDKNNVVRMPKAYLAGTEIFYPNSEETQKYYHELCEKYGIIGLYPSDIAPDDEYKEYVKKDNSVPEMEKTFFTHDVNHIRRCDIIIANLNCYRGTQPDSGTVAECGIAYGWGKDCFAFIDDTRPMTESYKGVTTLNEKDELCDVNGAKIENFDMPLNLMLNIPFTIFCGNLESALKGIREIYNKQLTDNGHLPFTVK